MARPEKELICNHETRTGRDITSCPLCGGVLLPLRGMEFFCRQCGFLSCHGCEPEQAYDSKLTD